MSTVSQFMEQWECVGLQALNRWMYETGVGRFQTKVVLTSLKCPAFFYWEWKPRVVFSLQWLAPNYKLSKVPIDAKGVLPSYGSIMVQSGLDTLYFTGGDNTFN